MLKKFMNRMHRDQKGITGLETAIILIAFVVVAAVFAFTALSAGLFSTEKSKEAVYSGLQETRSTMDLRNGVTAIGTAPGAVQTSAGGAITTLTNIVTSVQFMVANVMDGEAIDLHPSYTGDAVAGILPASPDLHKTVITLTDQNVQLTDCAWTVTWVGDENGDFSLDQNEKALITVWLVNNDAGQYKLGATTGTFYCNADDTAGNLLDANHTFTIQVKPTSGAVLTVEKTTPGYLDPVMDLH